MKKTSKDCPLNFDKATAKILMPFIGRVIAYSHDKSNGKWGASSYPGEHIRMNVGFTEILTSYDHCIDLIVDWSSSYRFKLPKGVHIIKSRAGLSEYYPSIPNSACLTVPLKPVMILQGTLKKAKRGVFAAIEKAGQNGMGQGIMKAHSKSLIIMIANYLDQELPQPKYVDVGIMAATLQKKYFEGGVVEVRLTKYERNPAARLDCINHFGFKCAVCEFCFADFYGPIGDGFIHVHHLKPMAHGKSVRAILPQKHLRPVCPNCHAMLHTEEPPLLIEELRKIIKNHGRRQV